MNGIKPMVKTPGFSLVELMIAVAVIGIIGAIAVPYFSDYMDTASQGVMRNNIESIRLFEEERKLSLGAYVAGTYDPADPDNGSGLKKVLGWSPRTTEDKITYVVDNVTSNGYRFTATGDDGSTVVVTSP
ncbi:MAG: type II secretion system protein [Pseudomonadales bacterium]|jgi:prepilin-type N-terminal cleavage/methylation domain-containing protein|nr:type II secretion system protein [Pseudomonadales bacterium]MDP7144080.1 type II secretion system protein [Pseudomonadales bacterium]MDP7359353.1 type II secretion system protein [Pseudomonadales bacterium]MDP7594675.1 type II secretion system protein [Pseudomonadales bacterium]HJN50367.1 type II secretion system protein [Pseudomonadales bacterium]|tara:strand:- start:891 stop:1280 length:390 start_codon:yes stop_codon:yes gene_type:complete